jgi:hypothetical protein
MCQTAVLHGRDSGVMFVTQVDRCTATAEGGSDRAD